MMRLRLISAIALLCFLSANVLCKTAEELVQEGIQLHDSGKYKEAIAKYEEALKLDPENEGVFYEIAFSSWALKDYAKAVEYDDKLINGKSKYMGKAYTMKGNILDEQGKPEEAIKLYKDAVKICERDNMLHYNMGLTYFNMKNYDEAEKCAETALSLNRNHPSSHTLLAMVMQKKNERTKMVLAECHFLLLEPASKRSKINLSALMGALSTGVSTGKDGKINIEFGKDDDKDPFATVDLTIQLLQAAKSMDANKGKSEQDIFCKNMEAIFKILGDMKKENKGFWWDFYVDFFDSLEKSGNTEVFCYYISQSGGKDEVKDWLKANKDKVDKLVDWYNKYTKK
jgi:tetratricopeptide (TPR) repeat protein